MTQNLKVNTIQLHFFPIRYLVEEKAFVKKNQNQFLFFSIHSKWNLGQSHYWLWFLIIVGWIQSSESIFTALFGENCWTILYKEWSLNRKTEWNGSYKISYGDVWKLLNFWPTFVSIKICAKIILADVGNVVKGNFDI